MKPTFKLNSETVSTFYSFFIFHAYNYKYASTSLFFLISLYVEANDCVLMVILILMQIYELIKYRKHYFKHYLWRRYI